MNATLLPITFTEGALREIKRLNDVQEKNKSLRIGVKNGGCSGHTYVLEFDDPSENDIHYMVDNVPVVMHPEHIDLVKNMTIDYNLGLNNRGFTFNNPNASTTCGCGTSFGS